MYNAAVKTGGHYTLKIVRDEDALNPRQDYDNFGHMACWHSRYNLGDKHDYSDPGEFLKDLARRTRSEKDIISYVKDGNADGLTLTYNKSNRAWELNTFLEYFNQWAIENSYGSPLDMGSTMLSEAILENMGTKDLMNLAERSNIIMPLYLYDHSGITISTSDFRDRWDSGQIGWTYVGHEDIAKEYGDASAENIEKARRLLNAETETYDCYLRGECYGFQLYRDGEEADSCWGFLGSFNAAKDALRAYLPEDAAPLINAAEYGDDQPEYDPEDEAAPEDSTEMEDDD
jgi:hypothetical protein